MDVLVIGGSGYMSSAVVTELLDAGHRVTVYTRGKRPLPDGVSVLSGDRKDYAAFAAQFEGRPFDAVIDCICYTPEDARADLQAFGGRIGHLILISTDFVYGPHRRLPMDEDTPTQALSTYGRNKATCEGIFFQAWAEEQFPATSLRPPHIMGAGGQLGGGTLQGRDPMLLDRLAQRKLIPLLDGGQLLIQPIYHRDIGRACVAALGKPATFGRAYNCAGPDCVTTREYYDMVAAVLGIEDPVYHFLPSAAYVRAFPERAPFAYHRMYSLARMEADTGYRPHTPLRHAICEMVDWLQANGADRPCAETEQEAALAALMWALDEQLEALLK